MKRKPKKPTAIVDAEVLPDAKEELPPVPPCDLYVVVAYSEPEKRWVGIAYESELKARIGEKSFTLHPAQRYRCTHVARIHIPNP